MGIGASAMVLIAAASSVNNDVGKEIYYKGLHGQKACVECHLQSGSGMIEGNVLVLPVDKKSLFSEYSGIPEIGRESLRFATTTHRAIMYHNAQQYGKTPSRVAYTDKTLSKVISTGIDPSKRQLHPIMPKFEYSKSEMNSLISFLKTLNEEVPVGVSSDKIKMVSIVSDKVSDADIKILTDKIESFVKLHNRRRANIINDYRFIDYSVWKLTGDESTWNDQLSKLYKETPPALIVSGLTNSSWNIIHDFSEKNHIPTLLPITNQPVQTQGLYTFYWDHGVYGEGTIIGEHIKSNKDKTVVIGSTNSTLMYNGIIDKTGPISFNQPIDNFESVVILDNDYTLIQNSLKQHKKVIVSASVLGDNIFKLPLDQKENIDIVYPYFIPQNKTTKLKYRTPRYGERPGVQTSILVDNKIDYKANTITYLLGDIMTRLRGNFTSNHIIDTISTIPVGGDMGVSDDSPYHHISFSPKQRFVGSNPKIVKLENQNIIVGK